MLVSIAILAIMAIAAWRLNTPKPSDVTLGHHSIPIQYISFADAHRQPIIKFGGFEWPKRVPGIPQKDDPSITMGYLIIDLPVGNHIRMRSATEVAEFQTSGIAKKEVIPVIYPSAPDALDCTLGYMLKDRSERVRVTRKFVPKAIPPRMKASEATVNGWRLRASFVTGGKGYATVNLECSSLRGGSLQAIGYGLGGDGPIDNSILLTADREPDGTIVVTGTVSQETGFSQPAKKKTPFKLVLKPRP